MSAGKIACLLVYAVLALVAVVKAGTTAATVSTWILVGLLASHVVEMIILFRLCQRASGSLAGNLFNVLVFGYFHTVEMKASLPQE
jgi:uncharacterized protein YhhL (DUF1145 family)